MALNKDGHPTVTSAYWGHNYFIGNMVMERSTSLSIQ